VRITRRHHPLAGEELEVVSGSQKRIVVQLPDGSSMTILREWTDADGVAPEPAPAQEALFTTTALQELAALVDDLRARS
jgi:hypothetical protein